MSDGASRTRLFTASWPPLNGELADGASPAGKAFSHQTIDPYCQVTVRAMSRGSLQRTALNLGGVKEQDGIFPSTDNNAVAGIDSGVNNEDNGIGVDDPIFVESSLLMRSYNSISVSDYGKFSLTLSECRGYKTAGTTITSLDGEQFQGEAPSLLLFLPLPHSIVFDVDDKIPNGRDIIGNFHLLPIAHAASTRPMALSSSSTSRSSPTDETFDVLYSQPSRTSQPPVPTASGVKRMVALRGTGIAFGRGFIAGLFAGCVVFLLLMWIRVPPWRERGVWERCIEWLHGEHGMEQRSIEDRSEDGKEDEKPRQFNDKETSDDDSSDSDGILNGNVPDPVGLPRNEKDWRALFDTLYEDGKGKAAVTKAPSLTASTFSVSSHEAAAFSNIGGH